MNVFIYNSNMNDQQKNFENILENLISSNDQEPDTYYLCTVLNKILECYMKEPKLYEDITLKWLQYLAEYYTSYNTITTDDIQIEIKYTYFYNFSIIFQEFIFLENIDLYFLQNILLIWIEIVSKTDKNARYKYYLSNKDVFIQMVELLKAIGYYPCQTTLFELLLRFIVSDKNRLNIVNDIFIGNKMKNIKQYIIDMKLKNYAKDIRPILNEINEKFYNIISIPLRTILCDSITFIEPIVPHKKNPNESLTIWLDLNCVRKSVTFTVDASTFDHSLKHQWIDCEILHNDMKNISCESYSTDSFAIIIELHSHLIIHDKRFTNKRITNSISFIMSNQLDKAKILVRAINDIINEQNNIVTVEQGFPTAPLTPPPKLIIKETTENHNLRKKISTNNINIVTHLNTNKINELQSIDLSRQQPQNETVNSQKHLKELSHQKRIMGLSHEKQHAQFSYIRAAQIGFSPEHCNYSIPKGYNDGDHIKKFKKESLKRKHRKTTKFPTKYDMTGYVYKFFVSKNKSNQINNSPLPLTSEIRQKEDACTSIKMNQNEIENYSIYDAITICDNISERNFEKTCTMQDARDIVSILSDNDILIRQNISQCDLQIINSLNETQTFIIDVNTDKSRSVDSGENSEIPENDITNQKCDKNWVLNNFLQDLRVNDATTTTATVCNRNDSESINVEPSIELMEISHNIKEIQHRSVQKPLVPIECDNNKMTNELIESFKVYIIPFCKWKAVPILERFEIVKTDFENHLNDLIEIYKQQIYNFNILLKDNVYLHRTFNRNLTSEEKLIQMLYYGEKCLNDLKSAAYNVKELMETSMNQLKLDCDGVNTKLIEKIDLLKLTIWNNYILNVPKI